MVGWEQLPEWKYDKAGLTNTDATGAFICQLAPRDSPVRLGNQWIKATGIFWELNKLDSARKGAPTTLIGTAVKPESGRKKKPARERSGMTA
ncbi:MAG TPA: hypothetical protein DCY13_20075 [Verrucomicrobiales bacterium]|nr:hypothetical protein [Verrucomicrobiales bacterium]